MMQSTYMPQHLRTRTFLPGHGRAPRTYATGTLPNTDANERRTRRTVWTRGQNDRQEHSERTGRIAFAGALLALLIAVTVAMTTTSATSRALSTRTPDAVELRDTPPVQLVKATMSSETVVRGS